MFTPSHKKYDSEDIRQPTKDRHAVISDIGLLDRAVVIQVRLPAAKASCPSHRPVLQCQNRGQENEKTKVVIARGIHLFPSRTEKLSPATPMVLRKRESR